MVLSRSLKRAFLNSLVLPCFKQPRHGWKPVTKGHTKTKDLLQPFSFTEYQRRKWQARSPLRKICWSEYCQPRLFKATAAPGQQVNKVSEKNQNVQSVGYQGKVILVASGQREQILWVTTFTRVIIASRRTRVIMIVLQFGISVPMNFVPWLVVLG